METLENISTEAALTPAESRDAIISRAIPQIAEGKSIRAVAEDCGLATMTLYGILKTVPEKFREAQETGAVIKIEAAGEQLEGAKNHLEVSRAREIARYWFWVGERLVPRFAPRQEISGPGGGPIVLEDRELARRFAFIKSMAARNVIDVEPIREPDAIASVPPPRVEVTEPNRGPYIFR